MEILKGIDVEQFLWQTIENSNGHLQADLGSIFEPNSITVETYRVKGREFGCRVTGYRFTEIFGNLQGSGDVLTSPQKMTVWPRARRSWHLSKNAS